MCFYSKPNRHFTSLYLRSCTKRQAVIPCNRQLQHCTPTAPAERDINTLGSDQCKRYCPNDISYAVESNDLPQFGIPGTLSVSTLGLYRNCWKIHQKRERVFFCYWITNGVKFCYVRCVNSKLDVVFRRNLSHLSITKI